jgi:hypothetical protein
MRIKILLRPLLGVSNRELQQAIAQEQSEGAKFERVVFPVESLKDIHLIQFFKKTDSGRVIAGLGTDRDEKKAYRKAVFEYFERQAVVTTGFSLGFDSTNGVGAHRYPALAFRAGVNELFERDAFLRHWYSKTPFTPITEPHDLSIQLAVSDFKKLGYETILCKTRFGFLSTTLAFLVNRNTGGFALGLSSGRGRRNDVHKALVESAVNLFFGNEGKPLEELYARINDYGVKALVDHRSYWLLLNSIPDWVTAEQTFGGTQEGVTEQYPKIERVMLSETPVPVVGARSDGVLDLVLGMPSEKDISILRASNLIPPDGEFLPHPIP